jgi:integrase/recombinase XerD
MMDPTVEPQDRDRPLCSLLFRRDSGSGISPYRLLGPSGKEIAAANEFLDALATRGLSERSLRAYGYSLVNLWRWLAKERVDLRRLSEADLMTYIRFQHGAAPAGAKVAPTTINHRLTVVRSLYRYHAGRDMPSGRRDSRGRPFPYCRGPSADIGYLFPARARMRRLWVRVPRRAVVPLTTEEVGEFLGSLRSWRDLSMAALMLLCGLRSREVIGLDLDDLNLLEGQIRVRGKGDKDRVVPLPPAVASPIRAYLDIERPSTSSEKLFLTLKGPRRGLPLTPAGLRMIFRYHRKRSRVLKANPHRFRHTFGADMARAGISLPALMHLMGHRSIRTTMLYVELSPKDVWEEFQRVVSKLQGRRIQLGSPDRG